MNRFFGSFFGSLVGVALIALLGFGIWQVQLPASAAPTATPTEEPAADDVVCVTSSDGDDICLTPADWLVLFEQIAELTGTVTTADAPATPAAEATAPADSDTVATGDWKPEEKCQWLRENFPQSTEGVQALGVALAAKHGVVIPKARVTTHIYHCDATNSVFDGLIILGPNEGFTGAVTLDVPVNGAVDAYDPECGAVYSDTPALVNALPNKCDSTWRAVSGTVKALRLTYWPWNDDNPPTLVGIVAPAAAAAVEATVVPTATEESSLVCIAPDALATEMGWKNKGWADETYGGLRVELTKAGELPELWEALASGRNIKQDSVEREMVPGVWTIYPPYDCREELGFSR